MRLDCMDTIHCNALTGLYEWNGLNHYLTNTLTFYFVSQFSLIHDRTIIINHSCFLYKHANDFYALFDELELLFLMSTTLSGSFGQVH